MNDYVVALVFSNFVLSKIYNIFFDYLKADTDDICMSKIERYKDKRTGELKESNRTLFLIRRNLLDRAIEAGLDKKNSNFDFRIVEYNLNAKNFPLSGYSENLYVSLPEFLKTEEAESIIKEKMRQFVKFGLLDETDYSLNIPLASRLTGKHRNFALLDFSEYVDLNTRVVIKLLLHNSYVFLPVTQTLYYIPFYWRKKYKINQLENPMIIKILKKN
jgi:hypothetical protein